MSFASGVPQTFERRGHLHRFRAQDQPTGVIARDGHQQGQEDTWREPTKDQWKAWIAAWLGWTLDAFDFTMFLLIMLPISQEFGVPLTAVTAVFAVTLWLRLLEAAAAGWMADHMGRRAPLIISILWYSICNFIAGVSPTFAFLFFFRALLGIGMALGGRPVRHSRWNRGQRARAAS